MPWKCALNTENGDWKWLILAKLLIYAGASVSLWFKWGLVYVHSMLYSGRRFWSRTSDKMDRWNKNRGGKCQKGKEKKREDERRERVRRKKIQMREKLEKSRNTVFFLMICGPEGRQVDSPKRRVGTHLPRWEMKSSTPLWREAHVQVKKYKANHCQSTFGSWDVEKVRAVVAQNTFPSQNVKSWQSRTQTTLIWRFRFCFAWQAQKIVRLAENEQSVKVLLQFQRLQPPLRPAETTTIMTWATKLQCATLRETTLH